MGRTAQRRGALARGVSPRLLLRVVAEALRGLALRPEGERRLCGLDAAVDAVDARRPDARPWKPLAVSC